MPCKKPKSKKEDKEAKTQ
jgi:hypothetical protein